MIITVAGSTFSFEPNDDELSGINIELAAFDGEVGYGQFPVPDPAASLNPATGRQFQVVQDFALLSNGFIIDEDRLRGPFRVSTQREHGYSIADANALLGGFRISRSRDAETDYARVKAFAAIDFPSWETTWVLNASTITMPAKKYRSDGGWTGELIPDVVMQTGKTLFVHDKAGGGRCLHYHLLTNGHTSGLTISDAVIQGAPGVGTVLNPQIPMRARTSIDLRNDVLGRDQAGRSSRATDPTSIVAHDADGLRHEALVDMEAVSQGDLDAQVAANLASYKNDYDTWPCAIGPLTGTQCGLIRVGDLITTTSSVMGLTASAQRIGHMRFRPAAGDKPAPGLWVAELELGAPVRRRARVKPSTRSLGIIIPTDPVNTDGDGNSQICFDIPAGWTSAVPVGYVPMTVSYLGTTVTMTAESGDISAQAIVYQNLTLPTPTGIGELRGSVFLPTLDASVTVTTFDIIIDDTFSPRGAHIDQSFSPAEIEWIANGAAGFETELIALSGLWYYAIRREGGGTYAKFWPGSRSEPVAWNGPGTTAAPDEVRIIVTVTAPTTFSQDFVFVFGEATWCYPVDVPVAFGGEVYGPRFVATADGSASLFTVPAYPGTGYVPGTLDARIDGIPQPVTETDPAAGTFDFGVDPDSGDIISAVWRVPS